MSNSKFHSSRPLSRGQVRSLLSLGLSRTDADSPSDTPPVTDDTPSVEKLTGESVAAVAPDEVAAEPGPTPADAIEACGSASEAASVESVLQAPAELLKQAFDDLKSPCPLDGPFSIYRLTGTDEATCPGLAGRTWLHVLSSRTTESRTRSHLGRVGQLMRRSGPTEIVRLTGTLIELLAASGQNTDPRLSILLASDPGVEIDDASHAQKLR